MPLSDPINSNKPDRLAYLNSFFQTIPFFASTFIPKCTPADYAKGLGDSILINTSQLLKPKEGDRFIIKLAANNMKTGEYKIWQLKASFVTSEGTVEYPFPLRIALPSDIRKE